jgi:hypothetical protein
MNPIKISLNRNSIPVELEGETPRKMELREMLASDRDKYLDGLSKRVRIDGAGKPAGVKDFDGMQAALITRCLYEGEKQVPMSEIQTWPASVVGELFEACQKLNKLNDKESEEVETEAKKG